MNEYEIVRLGFDLKIKGVKQPTVFKGKEDDYIKGLLKNGYIKKVVKNGKAIN